MIATNLKELSQEKERRLRQRFPTLGLEASLHGQRVQVSDIGLTGVGFTTCEPLQLKQRYELLIHSPIGDFTVAGALVWSHLTQTIRTSDGDVLPLYRAGLRFQPLDPRDAHYLVEFLVTLERRSRERSVERSQPAAGATVLPLDREPLNGSGEPEAVPGQETRSPSIPGASEGPQSA